nr:P5 [Andraeanum bacilliform virus]
MFLLFSAPCFAPLAFALWRPLFCAPGFCFLAPPVLRPWF